MFIKSSTAIFTTIPIIKICTNFSDNCPILRQLPVLHERRRFTDIMDEEIDDERRSRIDKYSAEEGHYVPRRLRYELSARPKALAEADAVREQKRQGQVSQTGGGEFVMWM